LRFGLKPVNGTQIVKRTLDLRNTNTCLIKLFQVELQTTFDCIAEVQTLLKKKAKKKEAVWLNMIQSWTVVIQTSYLKKAETSKTQ